MNEIVLLESKTLREHYCSTEEYLGVLDKAGQLKTLPGTAWATKEQVAEFYQIPIGTIDWVIKNNKDELQSDGYKILGKKELENLDIPSLEIPNRGLAILPRRAVLRVGLLLRDSDIAKDVRNYLLDIEENVKNIAEYQTQNKLVIMAEHLGFLAQEQARHAQEIKSQAAQLAESSDQFLIQTRMIKAIVTEINTARERIGKLENKVDQKLENYESRLHALEARKVRFNQEPVYISTEQRETLQALVKASGKHPKTIWSKFNKRFDITRYRFLEKCRFQEGLDWLKNYCS